MKQKTKFLLMLSFYLLSIQNIIAQGSMRPLFNGNDLTGWYSYLNSKGKNNDVEKVFDVKDGLLHISGKEFGYLCTNKEFTNFHLAAEFKWGYNKYPPRDADTTKRDNGICFFIPINEKDTVWPQSIECQIQEGDVGDIWCLRNATVVVDGVRSPAVRSHMIPKKKNAEKPSGEWNRVEIIVNMSKITYIVNGVVVNSAESPSLTNGKILIQSEGAEIYFRNIQIEEL